MRLLLVPIVLALLSTLADSRLADSEDESLEGTLTRAFKEYLEGEFRARPLEATRLGEHRFDDRLDDDFPAHL